MNATKGWVLAAVVVLGTTTSINGLVKGKFKFSSVLGAGIFGLFLFAIGMMNAELAKLFAILVMITAILVNGIPALQGMGNIGKLKRGNNG